MSSSWGISWSSSWGSSWGFGDIIEPAPTPRDRILFLRDRYPRLIILSSTSCW